MVTIRQGLRRCLTEGGEELHRLLEKIYHEQGFDFREYKESTLGMTPVQFRDLSDETKETSP